MKEANVNKRTAKIFAAVVMVVIFSVSAILEYYGKWDDINNVLFAENTTVYTEKNSKFNEHDEEQVKSKTNTVTFIDVGQGDCTLIKSNNQTMLIDAGEAENASTVISYLEKNTVNFLDYVVATHAHSDHIGALAKIINTIPVKNIVLADSGKNSASADAYIKFLTAANDSDANIIFTKKDDTFNVGNFTCKVLSPDSVDQDEENNNSIVMKIELGDTSFLLTGDAENKIEKSLIKNYNVKSEILKIAHHGSNSSSSNNFLDAVAPEIAVICVGENNRYNHPAEKAVKRIDEHNAKIFRTDLNGTIEFICTENSYTIVTEK